MKDEFRVWNVKEKKYDDRNFVLTKKGKLILLTNLYEMNKFVDNNTFVLERSTKVSGIKGKMIFENSHVKHFDSYGGVYYSNGTYYVRFYLPIIKSYTHRRLDEIYQDLEIVGDVHGIPELDL